MAGVDETLLDRWDASVSAYIKALNRRRDVEREDRRSLAAAREEEAWAKAKYEELDKQVQAQVDEG